MNTGGSFPEQMDHLEALLARQREAILQGEADALPRLAEQLHGRLTALLNSPLRARTPEERIRLQDLRKRSFVNRELINARQTDIKRSLDALSQGTPAAPAPQANWVYAAAGLLESSSRGRSLAKA